MNKKQIQGNILALHKEICKCAKCAGSTNKKTLCNICLALDERIDKLEIELLQPIDPPQIEKV